MSDPKTVAQTIIANVEKVIVGKHDTIELAIISLLCQGHLLIEDVPGVGKTMLAKSIAKSIGCVFKRIQFTPDMLPSDVTGVRIFDQSTRQFVYQPGPIQANIVLADEINRATPKTQAALLEAMEERQVTIDGETHKLDEPFLVMATQNPIEYEGTFPLPEAQLDRFLLRVRLGYPEPQDEIAVLDSQQRVHPIEFAGPGGDRARTGRRAGRHPRNLRGRSGEVLHHRDRDAHAQARRYLSGRFAARLADAVPRGAGARRAAGSQLRDPGRHQGAGALCAGAPHHRQPVGAHQGRGCHCADSGDSGIGGGAGGSVNQLTCNAMKSRALSLSLSLTL